MLIAAMANRSPPPSRPIRNEEAEPLSVLQGKKQGNSKNVTSKSAGFPRRVDNRAQLWQSRLVV
jgi:hypothetical protein